MSSKRHAPRACAACGVEFVVPIAGSRPGTYSAQSEGEDWQSPNSFPRGGPRAGGADDHANHATAPTKKSAASNRQTARAGGIGTISSGTDGDGGAIVLGFQRRD